ncbi:DNA helicase II [Reinekea marinisedimentorum]|uniref:DNA 3'-5' helicase n=1 Tax=Reinekea marinisedimentorum TaxID=230495 RepID=A0A4R3ID11_9GAMM|nr:DNA helicase II [Reinekea marinisedimentorum]TCS44085.1 DNA helicase-2/ATP-dependent DNA helicase PcrA [Reinekea marinisedimentorum]
MNSLQLEKLNPQQHTAVTSEAQHLLVLAGAGSGKTRVLTHRIGWLIAAGLASPYSVLAVTFTNKAAREMKGRIEELLEAPSQGLWIGTFHGLAHRLLKAHWQQAKLPQNFQVMDSDDQLRLVKRIIAEMNITDDRIQAKQVQWFIGAQKDEGRRAQYVVASGDWYQDTLKAIYTRYEEICQQSGLVDFGELLLRAHELWLNNPELLAHYKQRFTHVLVDEFQDINDIQYAWLRVLVGNELSLTIVGDDDQSIYGWRGAKVENIQGFELDFSGAQTVRLEQNYRSTANILNAANAVIANNNGRLGKDLWTDDDEGAPLRLYAGFNEQDEARYIADEMKRLIAAGTSPTEIALLYRSNAQSRVLEEALIHLQVPYRIYGGVRFYERMEIRNAVAYLRLVLNRQDDASMERIMNVPPRGIGNKTFESLRVMARDQGCSLWQAAQLALANNALAKRAANALQAFVELIEQMDSKVMGLDDLGEMIDYVNKHSGMIEYHEKEKGEKGRARVENLNELITAAQSYNSELDYDSSAELLALFISEASLDAGDAQAEEHEPSVNLMTLHSAKGLEFEYVFLAGMEENLFPHKMSIADPGGIQEERRLAYVGITRARKELTLTYAESRRLYGSETFNSLSRFVREIPDGLVNEVRLRSTVSRPANFGLQQQMAVEDSGLSIGQRVAHAMFGEGTITNAEGGGAQTRVHVAFDDGTERVLMLQYANLQPV